MSCLQRRPSLALLSLAPPRALTSWARLARSLRRHRQRRRVDQQLWSTAAVAATDPAGSPCGSHAPDPWRGPGSFASVDLLGVRNPRGPRECRRVIGHPLGRACVGKRAGAGSAGQGRWAASVCAPAGSVAAAAASHSDLLRGVRRHGGSPSGSRPFCPRGALGPVGLAAVVAGVRLATNHCSHLDWSRLSTQDDAPTASPLGVPLSVPPSSQLKQPAQLDCPSRGMQASSEVRGTSQRDTWRRRGSGTQGPERASGLEPVQRGLPQRRVLRSSSCCEGRS